MPDPVRSPGRPCAVALALACLVSLAPRGPARAEPPPAARYAWLESRGAVESPPASAPLRERFPAPEGFRRRPGGPFATWLRGLPLLPGRPPVRLFDGTPKAGSDVHAAVLDIDVGRRDLQQCADAVIRLRAEYLYAVGCEDAIRFDFTSGDPAPWPQWRDGARPRVRGSRVTWHAGSPADRSWRNLRRYLDTVFTYAGSSSLERELERVEDPRTARPGDVFIQGGFPGHAVLVIDVVHDDRGEARMLLAQSYMPAQQIHVLRNPESPGSPWYAARASGPLQTPEWAFRYADLHRFPEVGCPGP